MKFIFDNTLRWMIALFFVAVPFNPYISGITLYLWIFLVFADTTFLSRLRILSVRILAFIFLWMAVCFAAFNPFIAIKSAMIALGVSYFVLMKDEVAKKVYFCFILSIIWCLLQFTAFFIDKSIAMEMGPKNMSQLIWGSLATKTSSNQFALFLFPRMSGLSREAGFFASLLAIIFLIRIREGKLNKKEKFLFTAGYLASLSKASLALIIVLLLRPFKRFINKIPNQFTFGLVFIFFMVVASYLNVGSPFFYTANESLAHRLSASYMIQHMSIGNLIFGCDVDYTCFDYRNRGLVDFLMSRGGGFTPNVGINGVFINLGVLGFLGVAFGFQLLNFKSFDVLILVIFTSTVSLFTIDGFVIAMYYYIFTGQSITTRLQASASTANAP
ncbi:hypothetical protein [Serratia odorifera]|nr:hypothetical protein [Serratia odorifera]MBJ2065784.1 hypothetical protein [Serratia odorifera]